MPDPTPLDVARAAARTLSAAEWHLDAVDEAAFAAEPAATPPPVVPTPRVLRVPPPTAADPPPSAEQLAEAMLFVGGPPVTPAAFAAAVRVPEDVFRAAVESLNRKYKSQHRPYTIAPQADGFVLAVRPAFRGLRDRLFGGPRETRLSQPALDALSLVAYRQPVTKADVDALRGADSAGVLRQLVRVGLVAVARRGEAGRHDVCYGTTPRFLELFGLSSPDDLPRLGDARAV